MTIAAQPDVLGAVLGHLLSYTELTTLTSTRISGSWQESWNPSNPRGKPARCLQLRQNGTTDFDPETARESTRLDVRCYGPTDLEAMKVWRQLVAILCPAVPGQRNSFTRSDCQVNGVTRESGPTRTTEPNTEWPLVLGAVIVEWSVIPNTRNSES